jgi:alpha-1,4-digalacturonate transport system permease protein
VAPLVANNFLLFLWNSVFVTAVATAITLLTNSMAAFALSKYDFRGRNAVMLLIVATLMVPLSVILVPLYAVVNATGLLDSRWGVILPTVATPTGVFLLRQYMLTIPDELLEAARMDHASEWQIYWRIVLPLTAPALAVLAIFSVVWRWNDFLWPLIVLSRRELYTLQVGLNTYAGELNVQWHYILAMTVVTMIPVVVVFVFLQRFITTGIAGAGIK